MTLTETRKPGLAGTWRIVAERGSERMETGWNNTATAAEQQAVLAVNRSRLAGWDVRIEFQDEEWPDSLDFE